MNVYIIIIINSIIYNSSKVETIQMSINQQIHKQNVVYPYCGILFSHKNNEVLTHATTWMNLEDITLSEKASHQTPHII